MQGIMEMLCEMVRIPSLSCQEQRMAEYVKDYMEKFCDSAVIDEMYNVIAAIKGNRPGRTLMFNAHMDTVPPAEMEDPYKGVIMPGEKFGADGLVVYGRGACDDKGGCAAMMTAAQRIAANRDFAGEVIFTFVTQEENGQAPGTVFLLKNLSKKVDFAVLCEATGLDLYLGHRGKVEFFLDTYGKSAHASNPGNGVNAVVLMSDFIQRIKRMQMPGHEILGKCTSAITYISCPDPGKAAIIPAEASIRFDRRYLPSESAEAVYAQLDSLLRELCDENQEYRYKLETNYVMPPYYVEPGNPIVQLMQSAVTKVRGGAAQYKTWLSGTDGAFMTNDFGIPTIGLGPGNESNVHTVCDHVSEEQLVQAALIYEEIVRTA